MTTHHTDEKKPARGGQEGAWYEGGIAPHPLMPQEMVLRSCVYPGMKDVVHLTLETKDGTWAVFGSGATLGEAAADLFRLADHEGGVAALQKKSLESALRRGFQLSGDGPLVPVSRVE